MACRLTIDLSPPPFSSSAASRGVCRVVPILCFGIQIAWFCAFGSKLAQSSPCLATNPPPRPRPGPPGTPSLPRCLVRITLLAGHLGFRGKPIGTSPQHPSQLPMLLLLPPPLLPPSLTPPPGALSK